MISVEEYFIRVANDIEDAIEQLSKASIDGDNFMDEEAIICYRDKLSEWLTSYQRFILCPIDQVIEERLIRYTQDHDMILKDIDINTVGN